MARITVDQVKEELPAVKIRNGSAVYEGQIYGRKNKFAAVYFRMGTTEIRLEYTWAAIASSINSGKPLIM